MRALCRVLTSRAANSGDETAFEAFKHGGGVAGLMTPAR